MKSKLVTYINLTKNKTTVKNKQNNYIIPHVYVGQVQMKQGVDHFTTDCGASCQYVIGVDGSIGQSVSEADRAWTTGGNKEIKNSYGLFVGGTPNKSQKARGVKGVDYEAITIEMACEPKHPYKINDKVYNSLINLMADIAIRNNMGELKWKADPSLVGNPSEQNILVHRWFANKSCPGDYVYKHLGDICEKANEIIKANKANKTNNSSTNQTKPVEISTEQLLQTVNLPEQKQSEVVYTVRAGDTLSAIAKKYKTTYQKIAKDNNIKNVNILYVGQKLVIK